MAKTNLRFNNRPFTNRKIDQQLKSVTQQQKKIKRIIFFLFSLLFLIIVKTENFNEKLDYHRPIFIKDCNLKNLK